ncbi:GNAT family N-acetyltransferase [Lentzea tibetensis]|uniref:GNAT family N-acetyltransferase n=1 Tax=Lentzea tibetensis TaxID=2591470 RepID=A0A563EX23_9PSEU|nr:GNAT family protein [Lentzea tibetensis]TWP52112.1 GNAT family N-acetyltransferase [Lentzea tibetensis]
MERFTPDQAEELADFLTSSDWPFHSRVPDRSTVLRQVADGHWDGPSAQTFWIERRGVVRLFDLDDGSPLFDLRIAAAERGRGLGSRAVGWLTGYLFETLPANRVEATTRADNHAMRAVLAKHRYVLEARYRQTWPDRAGVLHDGVGYAVLRQDWDSGSVTPVNWEF